MGTGNCARRMKKFSFLQQRDFVWYSLMLFRFTGGLRLCTAARNKATGSFSLAQSGAADYNWVYRKFTTYPCPMAEISNGPGSPV